MECDVFVDEMMDVLYGEADPAAARRFAEHQAGCASCRDELSDLRRVRRDLASWKLPAGLESARPSPGTRPGWGRPWSGLAAAAALLLALGGALGLSGSELRYEEGRVSFRLGRAAGSDAEIRELLRAQEARHRQEIEVLRASLAVPARQDVLLQRVQQMIQESEGRQTVLVSSRVARLRDETETQRRYDLAQMGAGLSYLEGKTGLQMARTTELMGHVLQAAQQK